GNCIRSKLDCTANNIVKRDWIGSNRQTYCKWLARGGSRCACIRRDVSTATGVDLWQMRGDGLFAFTIQLLRRTKTTVRAAFGQQTIRMFAVNLKPLRLPIGTVRAFAIARFRAFVPVEPQPAQIV